jgi:UDP-2,3-diacylglucosamine pyrophosphatase LpxH
MSLFKKVAVCTDIHFGLKSNSLQHNQDCSDFIDWFIATAKEQGCETGMFLGDWSTNVRLLNMQTLQYSLRSLEKLSKAFDRFYFIPGNHDLVLS